MAPKYSTEKAPAKYDDYVFNVSEKFKKIAKEELGEDDQKRTQALAQFREWIAKHPHIRACRTDAVFLLRFLRPKKFSVPQACELLEQYLIYRQEFPEWFTKLDPNEPEMAAVIDACFSFPLLERDDQGRRVFLTNIENFDASKWTTKHMIRLHALVVEASLDDEESQIAGFHHFYDARGFGMKHVAMWSLVDLNNFLRKAQFVAPMRHRAVTVMLTMAHKLIEFALSLLTDKIKARVKVCKTNEEAKQHVDVKLLPEEYGGKVPMKDMIARFKEELQEKREALLALDDMSIDITKYSDKWSKNTTLENDISVIGSFRKLELD
ncbi:retinaldehyde-binding protein 1-like [Culicoides brevitarsis]|uniref:retinaldehyde-binding protein 1-like n=1 Tax=Culicoides brevitarsis TaxID=469753 RepID=UPI00307C2907